MYGLSAPLFDTVGMSGVSMSPLAALRTATEGGGSCAGGGAVGLSLVHALQFFAAASCVLTEPWPPQAHLNNETYFEFIVVGGGTAGAALAARLSEHRDSKVLLVEAGGDPPAESVIPGFKSAMVGSEYDWQFTTENDGVSSQALIGGRQPQPRGRMLGGCGALNDMVYARGFPIDYDGWARTLRQSGDPYADDWTWNNVIDYFKKTEHLTDERIVGDPELMKLHGLHGEIEVSGLNESSHQTDMFLRAFEEMGFNMVKDMTSPVAIGAGRHSHTIRNGRRDSTLTALLNKARNRTNLFVLKHAFVTKVLIENDTAYGVHLIYNNNTYHFYAQHEVILTAGTFNTPKILMMSGIGPRKHLEKFGIEVVRDLPVGRNLNDHVMVMSYISADNGTCYSSEASPHMDMVQYLYNAIGPYSVVNTMAAYMALNASYHRNVPDFAFYPSCMPVGTQFLQTCQKLLRFKEKNCKRLQNELEDKELLSIATVLLNPKSRGWVELTSADPRAPAAIYSGTFSKSADLAGYPEALDVAKRILDTSYFKSKNARRVDLDIGECRGKEGSRGAICMARAMALSAWHAAGTAPLGTVLDGRLRVRGVRGLRVSDASAMPQVVRGNTNAPVHMIAEKAAHYIKSEYNRS